MSSCWHVYFAGFDQGSVASCAGGLLSVLAELHRLVGGTNTSKAPKCIHAGSRGVLLCQFTPIPQQIPQGMVVWQRTTCLSLFVRVRPYISAAAADSSQDMGPFVRCRQLQYVHISHLVAAWEVGELKKSSAIVQTWAGLQRAGG